MCACDSASPFDCKCRPTNSTDGCSCSCHNQWWMEIEGVASQRDLPVEWGSVLAWIETIEGEVHRLRIEVDRTIGRPPEETDRVMNKLHIQMHYLEMELLAKACGPRRMDSCGG